MRRLFARLGDWLRWRQAYRWSVRSWHVPGDIEASRLVLATFRPTRTLAPLPGKAPQAGKLLVIAPHPDDESIGPGGTLLLARDAGCDVKVLFLTTGRPAERAARRQEAEDACRDAGFASAFAGYDADGIDVAGAAKVLAGVLADDQYDNLFVPFFLDDHDDHRRASEVLVAASRMAGTARALPRQLWAYHVYGPGPMNCIIDISGVACRKRALIARYRSQMASRDWGHFALGLNAVLSRFLPGGPSPRHAEGFMVLPVEEYVALATKVLAQGLYLDGGAGCPGTRD